MRVGGATTQDVLNVVNGAGEGKYRRMDMYNSVHVLVCVGCTKAKVVNHRFEVSGQFHWFSKLFLRISVVKMPVMMSGKGVGGGLQ